MHIVYIALFILSKYQGRVIKACTFTYGYDGGSKRNNIEEAEIMMAGRDRRHGNEKGQR